MAKKQVSIFCASQRSFDHLQLVNFSNISDFRFNFYHIDGEQKKPFTNKNFVKKNSQWEKIHTNWTLQLKHACQFILYLRVYVSLSPKNRHLRTVSRIVLFGNSNNTKEMLKIFLTSLFFSLKIILLNPIFYKFVLNLLFLSRDTIRIPNLDSKIFTSLLKKNRPDLIVAQTTMNDLSIFNLLTIAEKLNIKTLLIIDSWDNLGTKAIVPRPFTHVFVWSEQCLNHAFDYHRIPFEKISISGTPRSIQKISRKKIRTLNKSVINIAYLESSSEDLEHNLNILEQCFLKVKEEKQSKLKSINLKIKVYPFHKDERNYSWVLNRYSSVINYSVSKEQRDLESFLMGTDLVISESTTAGIQSASWNYFTLFISSNSSKIYLNGERAFKLPHLEIVKILGFPIIHSINLYANVSTIIDFIRNPFIPDVKCSLGPVDNVFEAELVKKVNELTK